MGTHADQLLDTSQFTQAEVDEVLDSILVERLFAGIAMGERMSKGRFYELEPTPEFAEHVSEFGEHLKALAQHMDEVES